MKIDSINSQTFGAHFIVGGKKILNKKQCSELANIVESIDTNDDAVIIYCGSLYKTARDVYRNVIVGHTIAGIPSVPYTVNVTSGISDKKILRNPIEQIKAHIQLIKKAFEETAKK